MSTKINFSDSTPAAPGAATNVKWQGDASDPRNVSAYIDLSAISGVGGVAAKTANYLAAATDNGKMLPFNGTNLTYTLKNPVPSSTWFVVVVNLAATALTIARNSLLINGLAANLTLQQNQYVLIYSDGTNYYAGPPAAATLAGDSDVQITSAADKDILAYKTADGKWENYTISALGLAILASPVFTGSPKAPTQTPGDNSTNIASTAYVDAAQALDEKLANKDANSGYAGLDASGRTKVGAEPAFTGDVTKAAGSLATVVAAVQGNAIDNTVLGAGQDGFVLAWVNASNKIVAIAPTAASGANAIQIRGRNISTAVPVQGQDLIFDKANNWIYKYPKRFRQWQYNPGNSGALTGAGTSIGFAGAGLSSIGAAATSSEVVGTSAEGAASKQVVGSSTSSRGLVVLFQSNSNSSSDVQKENLGILRMRLQLNQATQGRWWFGLCNIGSSVAPTTSGLQVDDIVSGQVMAFRFSNAPSSPTDSVWKGYVKDGTTAATASGSGTGSTPDTAVHDFVILFDGTLACFYVDGVLICSTSSHLPTASMAPFIAVDNLASNPAITPGITIYTVYQDFQN